MKFFDYKNIINRIKAYDFKKVINSIKSFEYKNPKAYKELFKDREARRKFLIVAICILAALFLKSCLFKPRPKQIMPRPVQTESVIKKDAPIYIESFGTLSSLEDVNIQAQVTGKILEVNFEEGDEVSEGDLLFVIDPSEYLATLQKAEAALAQDRAGLKLKSDNLERNKVLIEKELISQQDFEALQTEVEAAEAAVRLDMANLKLAKIDLKYCYIKSPISGLTGKRRVDPGNIVTANSGPVLVNVKSVDPLYLDFTISERELSKLLDAQSKGALKVIVIPEGVESDKVEGELVFLDNTIDEMTGTILLHAIIPNKERRLWAGQFATVRLILSIAKDAVLAPFAAVNIGQKGFYLFVVTDDNKADLRQISVGMREDDYIIVEKGVSAGEKVVTTGELGLAPGVPVIDVTDTSAQGTRDKAQGAQEHKHTR